MAVVAPFAPRHQVLIRVIPRICIRKIDEVVDAEGHSEVLAIAAVGMLADPAVALENLESALLPSSVP